MLPKTQENSENLRRNYPIPDLNKLCVCFTVYAAGDSYNDVAMLQKADRGFFFRPPENITKQFPDLPVSRTYQELLDLLFPRKE
jgi:hypothetical protein